MNDRQAFSLRRLWLLLGVCLAGLAVAASISWSRRVLVPHAVLVASANVHHPSELGRDRPLAIRTHARKLLPVQLAEKQAISSQLDVLSKAKPTSSLCLHLLRIHGPGATLESGKTADCVKVLDVLTDETASKAAFGGVAFARTRHGVRYPTVTRFPLDHDPAQESHRDQSLAAFAELGVPLRTPVRFEGSMLTLRDVLRDSIAEFHLAQQEIAWTSIAYALYLPPQREWENRYGERVTFNDLVGELVSRPLTRASCAGSHVLQAMAVIARADAEAPILSDPQRQQLGTKLEQLVRAATAAQDADGSWRSDWHACLTVTGESERKPAENPGDATARLVATGHLAECFLYLPMELQPAEDCMRRAGLWLQSALRAASTEDVRQDFCPYAHAACALRELMFVEEDPSDLVGHVGR